MASEKSPKREPTPYELSQDVLRNPLAATAKVRLLLFVPHWEQAQKIFGNWANNQWKQINEIMLNLPDRKHGDELVNDSILGTTILDQHTSLIERKSGENEISVELKYFRTGQPQEKGIGAKEIKIVFFASKDRKLTKITVEDKEESVERTGKREHKEIKVEVTLSPFKIKRL